MTSHDRQSPCLGVLCAEKMMWKKRAIHEVLMFSLLLNNLIRLVVASFTNAISLYLSNLVGPFARKPLLSGMQCAN